jgi:pimeloyl-ACP methyl ester carboxylesterase
LNPSQRTSLPLREEAAPSKRAGDAPHEPTGDCPVWVEGGVEDRDLEADRLALQRALTGSSKDLPLITIFGERNDPLGFQPRWKELFPRAQQVLVPRGNHFPMCDAPDLVAETIRVWYRERVASEARP